MSEWRIVKSSRFNNSRNNDSSANRGKSRGQLITKLNTFNAAEKKNPRIPQNASTTVSVSESRENTIFSKTKQIRSNFSQPRASYYATISKASSNEEESDTSSRSNSPDPDALPSLPPFHVSVFILCPFKNCPLEQPILNSTALSEHLKEQHKLVFINLQHVYMILERYLEYWSQKIIEHGIENTGAILDKDNSFFIIDPETLTEDKTLRENLQLEKLNEVLQIQARERDKEAKEERKCLFCKNICQNRSILFRHMFSEHNFNIGLPDNLVNVNEFLYILDQKLTNLQCLYCEKIFTSPAVLRKHMRKKKHFKINSRNRIYDRFYIINYLEPGKNWENYENEKYESDEDRRDDSWDDWDEMVVPEPTMCLFCGNMCNSPKDACQHMKAKHRFDLLGIKHEMGLDFYKTVMLINYIRRQASFIRCMACNTSFDDLQKMTEHMERENCFSKVPDLNDPLWKDPQYLFPAYENDPLLTGFEEARLSDDEDDPENMLNTIIVPEKLFHNLDEYLQKALVLDDKKILSP
ncbi:1434_t:CDS:2 [Ambispora leptoticha]|uniref:1434_t:CDS:1 n=1 Tax=Ambispora leptoticha TaxID=144679 RepID=A0A9N9AFK8_9GLOM|nr:1434_t:CDS:2 [Ambispora leptoticha]